MASVFNIKRVIIIGAGPSGLAAAKHLLATQAFEQIDIFEQQGEVGGVWNYNEHTSHDISIPQTRPDVPLEKPVWPTDGGPPIFSNPMYEHLNTNIPKTLMCFPDQDFPPHSLLFPTRQDVQDYIVDYARDLRNLITFSTLVQSVRLAREEGQDRWVVVYQSVITSETKSNVYDAVVMATGHYTVPFIPTVPGIEAFNMTWPSVISHSKSYRIPGFFAEKKVVVVGNSASGLDIGNQISEVCKRPLLNSVRTPLPSEIGHDGKDQVPIIVEYLVDQRGVRFEGGRVETGIDAIVYCTGFLFAYQMLETLNPPIITDGRRVIGLYQQLFDINHPTLAFPALPYKIVPFPIADVQGAALSRVWTNRLDLPSRTLMLESERKQVEELGNGRSFHVLGYPKDAKYLNNMHDWVITARAGHGKEPVLWNKKLLWIRKNRTKMRERFGETGGRARTMEELGFEFDDNEEI